MVIMYTCSTRRPNRLEY